MLFDLVKENERLILNLKNKVPKKSIHYNAFLSSFNALDNNNELQEYYINTIDVSGTNGYYIFRLYAILQGLFVSIDSLYALAYAISGSKNFININQNKELKQLKFIRNDVVGHPANRVYDGKRIGYCIYDKDDVSKDHFTYKTIVGDDTFTKTINISKMLYAYYDESNAILNRLASIKTDYGSDELLNLSYDLLQKYQRKFDIDDVFNQLINKYKEIYPSGDKDRFIYRISLIHKLKRIKTNNILDEELVDYSIGYQIVKVHEIICSLRGIPNKTQDIPRRVPKYIISMFKMFNNNAVLAANVRYLCDVTHPLFKTSYKNCMEYALKFSLKYCIVFLEKLNEAILEDDIDLVYCYAVCLKNYKGCSKNGN